MSDRRPGPFERPVDADVSICVTCGATIFRTNMDGHWHHRGKVDHPPEPVTDPRTA
jgi:hypothetical protein